MLSEREYNEIIRRVAITKEEILKTVQDGIYRGNILTPMRPVADNFAGGTNLCPNSDFSFSHLAATVAATSPSDATDPNKTIYRCFRQATGANISTTGVRTSDLEASGYIPVWNKTYGVIELGSDDIADNYDIAIQLTQNWAAPSQLWYIRIACASMTADAIPDGLKLYAGLWRKESGGTQGWLEAATINITASKFYVPASTTISYKVIAQTDAGVSLESQVLTITDAPAVLSSDNYIRIEYPSISGFIEFRVYKQVAGVTTLIAYERNSTTLHAYDIGQTIEVIPTGFPSASTDKPRAYAEVLLDARQITEGKTMNNLTLKIPNYDMTLLAAEGTYLRIGLTGEAAVDRQVAIDTVYAGMSFNRWSVSPYDNYQSAPSTSISTGVDVGGSNGGTPPPIGGGNTCVASWLDLQRADGEWEVLGEAEEGLMIFSGTAKPNQVERFIDGEVSQYYLVRFSHGLVIPASPSHRFIRSFSDGSGISAAELKVGEEIQGGDEEHDFPVTVVSKSLVLKGLKVRSVQNRAGNTQFYAVGNRKTGKKVYNHNRKRDEEYYYYYE